MPKKGILTNPLVWRTELGLFPVPLFPVRENGDAFVLLNGAKGNFCLDAREAIPAGEARNQSWSSNVGHHVRVTGDDVVVTRWDSPHGLQQRFPVADVAERLEKFHQWIARESPPSELGIVSHAVQVFRSLRNALGESFDGTAALKAYLYLLACVTEVKSRKELDPEKWLLSNAEQEIALEVPDNDWDALYQDLAAERPIFRLTADWPLVLRHTAGALFQEAHFVVSSWSSNQRMLPGFSPPPVGMSKQILGVGVHFTPAALSRTVVEEALTALGDLPQSLTAFDPACGSGEFLRELVRQLEVRSYKGKVRIIGWDIAEAACDMARFVLAWESKGKDFPIEIEIVHRDAFSDGAWPAAVDLILMNPPFMAMRDMDADHQLSVANALGKLGAGKPDLAMAFLWKAIECLAENAIIGCVLPASVLDGTSAARLRRALSDLMEVIFLARLGSHDLFPFARVDAGVYIARRGHPGTPKPTTVFWADHRATSTASGLRTLRRLRSAAVSPPPVQEDGYSIYESDSFGHSEESWAPRPYREWKLWQRAGNLPRATKLFHVRQGVLTGLNRAFIVSDEKLKLLPENERVYFRQAVLNESIEKGRIVKPAFVFFPYLDRHIADVAELKKRVPFYFERFLEPNREALCQRAGIDKSRWWELTRPRLSVVSKALTAKIVSTYFGDAGSFAWDESGDAVVVQGYSWTVARKKPLHRVVWLGYLALLNSPVMSSLLAASSNNVGGGQWNLSRRFIERVPLPDLTSKEFPPDLLHSLGAVGEEIHVGSFELSVSQSRSLGDLAEAAFNIGQASD